MGFARLAPMGLVKLFRAAPGDRQGSPILPGVNSGDLDDLADVVAGMAQGALQGQRHGMWLPTNQDGPFEVFRLQGHERRQQAGPAPLPQLQEFRPAAEGVHELIISIAPRLLAGDNVRKFAHFGEG